MPTSTQELTVSFTPDDIADVEQFENARRQLYEGQIDPSQRRQELGQLMARTVVAGGEISLMDATLDRLTDPDANGSEAERINQNVRERILASVSNGKNIPEVINYKVIVDDNGEVQDVLKSKTMAQSGKILSSARRTSDGVPYGPSKSWLNSLRHQKR